MYNCILYTAILTRQNSCLKLAVNMCCRKPRLQDESADKSWLVHRAIASSDIGILELWQFGILRLRQVCHSSCILLSDLILTPARRCEFSTSTPWLPKNWCSPTDPLLWKLENISLNTEYTSDPGQQVWSRYHAQRGISWVESKLGPKIK
jgi:hypothetical protein